MLDPSHPDWLVLGDDGRAAVRSRRPRENGPVRVLVIRPLGKGRPACPLVHRTPPRSASEREANRTTAVAGHRRAGRLGLRPRPASENRDPCARDPEARDPVARGARPASEAHYRDHRHVRHVVRRPGPAMPGASGVELLCDVLHTRVWRTSGRNAHGGAFNDPQPKCTYAPGLLNRTVSRDDGSVAGGGPGGARGPSFHAPRTGAARPEMRRRTGNPQGRDSQRSQLAARVFS